MIQHTAESQVAPHLRCERFRFCSEATDQPCRLGIPIYEAPTSYTPRSAAVGRKIGWRNAFQAFWTLLWWGLAPVKLLDDDELAWQVAEGQPCMPHFQMQLQATATQAEAAV